jgi:hypothetical protein
MVNIRQSLRGRMQTDLNAWRGLSRSALILRVGLIGAAAGFVAWAGMLVAHVLWEIGRPSGIALLLAIPRGALFGAILAVILHAYWKRQPGTNESKEDQGDP